MRVGVDCAASTASPSSATFVVFLAVMLLGTLLTGLLVPPERVLRRDGRRVAVGEPPSAAVGAHSVASIPVAMSFGSLAGLTHLVDFVRWVVCTQVGRGAAGGGVAAARTGEPNPTLNHGLRWC